MSPLSIKHFIFHPLASSYGDDLATAYSEKLVNRSSSAVDDAHKSFYKAIYNPDRKKLSEKIYDLGCSLPTPISCAEKLVEVVRYLNLASIPPRLSKTLEIAKLFSIFSTIDSAGDVIEAASEENPPSKFWFVISLGATASDYFENIQSSLEGLTAITPTARLVGKVAGSLFTSAAKSAGTLSSALSVCTTLHDWKKFVTLTQILKSRLINWHSTHEEQRRVEAQLLIQGLDAASSTLSLAALALTTFGSARQARWGTGLDAAATGIKWAGKYISRRNDLIYEADFKLRPKPI